MGEKPLGLWGQADLFFLKTFSHATQPSLGFLGLSLRTAAGPRFFFSSFGFSKLSFITSSRRNCWKRADLSGIRRLYFLALPSSRARGDDHRSNAALDEKNDISQGHMLFGINGNETGPQKIYFPLCPRPIATVSRKYDSSFWIVLSPTKSVWL